MRAVAEFRGDDTHEGFCRALVDMGDFLEERGRPRVPLLTFGKEPETMLKLLFAEAEEPVPCA